MITKKISFKKYALIIVVLSFPYISSEAHALSQADARTLLEKTGYTPSTAEIEEMMRYPTRADAIRAVVNSITDEVRVPVCPWMSSRAENPNFNDTRITPAYAVETLCGGNLEPNAEVRETLIKEMLPYVSGYAGETGSGLSACLFPIRGYYQNNLKVWLMLQSFYTR
jgi:hypothetical protein